jgi:uncharacterized coiled-coil protein SlyX
MNKRKLTMKKSNIPFSAVLSVLVCVIFLYRAQAVVPAPDGGYPGGNTAEGQNALLSLTTGQFNTAVGLVSLASETEGSSNTGIGAGALFANTGSENTATGTGGLLSNTTGGRNTATGAFALFSSTAGEANTATGSFALFNNTGSYNTAIGSYALLYNISGENNTAIGESALYNSSGSGNIAVGLEAGFNVTTANNAICIGIFGMNVSNSCFIGNIRGVTTAHADGIPVLIDSSGQLGTQSSSRRFKHDIKPMDEASESLLALKPVTFHYKSDQTNRPEFGLIAEEVADVNPDLVVRDEKGKIYTVRYDAVNAMLLNEFLKEHRKVEAQQSKIAKQAATIAELKSTVAQQQKGMEVLGAQLEEQAAQIQKVSAQLETSREAANVVVNNP